MGGDRRRGFTLSLEAQLALRPRPHFPLSSAPFLQLRLLLPGLWQAHRPAGVDFRSCFVLIASTWLFSISLLSLGFQGLIRRKGLPTPMSTSLLCIFFRTFQVFSLAHFELIFVYGER